MSNLEPNPRLSLFLRNERPFRGPLNGVKAPLRGLIRFDWFRQHILRNPARMLVLSFCSVILVGTLLLLLPISSAQQPLSLVDALFTITSATCVTGLTVLDIGTRLSAFGQAVLLVCIQVGGLGILTFSTLFIALLGGRVSFGGQSVLETSFSQRPMGTFASLLKTIFLVTLGIETAGTVLLYLQLRNLHPQPGEALWYSAFHSVSAFCNAGLSLYPDNLARFVSNWYACLLFCGLIITGGLGFVVFYDVGRMLLRERRLNFDDLNFHARLTLIVTGSLIATAAALFFIIEFGNVLKPLPWPTKILASIFQAVTPRTAGFNTVEIGSLTNTSLFFIILLMFIGGSSGSCAGGIKTSTFAVLLAYFRAQVHEYGDVELFRRRVPDNIVSKAFAVTLFAITMILVFSFVILAAEFGDLHGAADRGRFLEVLFEVASAFGTVGLSTGITPTLSDFSRVALSVLMLLGRVGPLTVAVAATRAKIKRHKLASETFLVG